MQEGVDAELMTVVNVPNGEMPWCYSAADALLLCSDYEGSPTSIKEALACNRPVVATEVGDVGELLNGIAGTRICPQDAGTIARNLREVFDWSRSSEFRGGRQWRGTTRRSPWKRSSGYMPTFSPTSGQGRWAGVCCGADDDNATAWTCIGRAEPRSAVQRRLTPWSWETPSADLVRKKQSEMCGQFSRANSVFLMGVKVKEVLKDSVIQLAHWSGLMPTFRRIFAGRAAILMFHEI